jgi:hypothetical protein
MDGRAARKFTVKLRPSTSENVPNGIYRLSTRFVHRDEGGSVDGAARLADETVPESRPVAKSTRNTPARCDVRHLRLPGSHPGRRLIHWNGEILRIQAAVEGYASRGASDPASCGEVRQAFSIAD